MSVFDPDELDRIFSLWEKALWKAHGMTLNEAAEQRDLYRYRITRIDRLDANLFEIQIEFAPNAVYGVKHLPGSKASIVVPLL